MRVEIQEQAGKKRSWMLSAKTPDNRRAIQTALRWLFGTQSYLDVTSTASTASTVNMKGYIHGAKGEEGPIYVLVTVPL